MAKLEINANELMKNTTVTVKVHGVKRLQIRLWIGLQLIRFGVFVTGMRFEVETKPDG